MNSSCTTTFTYWDSWQFQATFSHIIIMITLPINLFGGYCIIKKTPRNRRSARWYLLHLHAWTIISDLLIGGLVCPYMFFPVLVGISVGVFSWFSVPVWIQVFCAQVGLGGLAVAIVMLFENRHNTLVRGRFKIEAEWIRYTFYGINGVYALLFLLPVYFRIPDPEWAKPILLKVSIPVGVIVMPMIYCFYSIVWQQYNQMLNNIAIICISLHGMSSTITLIWLNPIYRHFTLSVLTCFKYDSNIRRSSVMTVSPATITQH
uniref:G protein-coupled receptor n=1 Tax=Caenorhabditis tropicalis TaxID=1561998 RepID=A0A1I7T9B3_9PELO